MLPYNTLCQALGPARQSPGDSLSHFIMDTSMDSETSDQDVGLGDDPSIRVSEVYVFEPVLADVQLSDGTHSDTGDDTGDEPSNERLLNANWCQCGSCSESGTVHTLNTRLECQYCQEIPAIAGCTLDYQCITQNPHFSTICLDAEVLEVALLAIADVRVETLLWPIASW